MAMSPVSAYAKLGRGPYSFLLESVAGGEKWAAYSFIGIRPRAVLRGARERGFRRSCAPGRPRPGESAASSEFHVAERVKTPHPIAFIDTYLVDLAPAVPLGPPRFFGGAVG